MVVVDYVFVYVGVGNIDDVLVIIDKFVYEKLMFINVGDEKGMLFDVVVWCVDLVLVLELGIYFGYSVLWIVWVVLEVRVYFVEFVEVNVSNVW